MSNSNCVVSEINVVDIFEYVAMRYQVPPVSYSGLTCHYVMISQNMLLGHGKVPVEVNTNKWYSIHPKISAPLAFQGV
jgi:hypothetical protein